MTSLVGSEGSFELDLMEGVPSCFRPPSQPVSRRHRHVGDGPSFCFGKRTLPTPTFAKTPGLDDTPTLVNGGPRREMKCPSRIEAPRASAIGPNQTAVRSP